MLRDAGCELVQGYLLSRPVPARPIEELFEANSRLKKSGAELPSDDDDTVAMQLQSLLLGLEPARRSGVEAEKLFTAVVPRVIGDAEDQCSEQVGSQLQGLVRVLSLPSR